MSGAALRLVRPPAPRHAACPEWCTDEPDHEVEDLTPGNGRWHQGAHFGPFYVEQPEIVASRDDDEGLYDLTPEDLRRIAADCIAAAEWLEAHQA